MRKAKQQIRPFCQSSGVRPRGYSCPLQRIIVDFSADHAFGRAAQKLKEHDGLALPVSSLHHTTLGHSQRMLAQQQTVSDFPVSDGHAELIVETDGFFFQ